MLHGKALQLLIWAYMIKVVPFRNNLDCIIAVDRYGIVLLHPLSCCNNSDELLQWYRYFYTVSLARYFLIFQTEYRLKLIFLHN